jgi:hypothetical protein
VPYTHCGSPPFEAASSPIVFIYSSICSTWARQSR